MCPDGKQVLGGGGHIDQAAILPDDAVKGSEPAITIDGRSGWHFSARWNDRPATGWSVIVHAICANVE